MTWSVKCLKIVRSVYVWWSVSEIRNDKYTNVLVDEVEDAQVCRNKLKGEKGRDFVCG